SARSVRTGRRPRVRGVHPPVQGARGRRRRCRRLARPAVHQPAGQLMTPIARRDRGPWCDGGKSSPLEISLSEPTVSHLKQDAARGNGGIPPGPRHERAQSKDKESLGFLSAFVSVFLSCALSCPLR